MRKTFLIVLGLAIIALGTFTYCREFRLRPPPEGFNWNYHQIQRIPKEEHPFSFAVLGDNKNSFSTFQDILHDLDANRDRLAFAIDLGDLVFDGERAKYRIFYNQIKDVQLPFLVAIGNHDIREEGRAEYYELFGPFYYAFTVGNARFIVLDDANQVRLDPSQMEWLKEELEDARALSFIFVFLHIPLRDPRPELSHSLGDEDQVEELLSLFRAYHVTRVFASHIHGYFTGEWEGVPYTITGGAGAELMGTDPEHYFYHYMVVNVDGGEVTISVIRFPPPPAELWDRLLHTAAIYIHSFFVTNGPNLTFIALALLLAFVVYTTVHGKKKRNRE